LIFLVVTFRTIFFSKISVEMPTTFRFKTTLASDYGASLISAIVSTWLYGMTLLLVLQYFMRYAGHDRLLVRMVVGILITLATLEAIFVCHQIYWTLILNPGPTLTNIIPFSTMGVALGSYLTSFVAQLFYASRIWNVCNIVKSRLRFMLIPVLLLALMQIVTGLVFTIYLGESKLVSRIVRIPNFASDATSCQAAASGLCDILISITLCTVFRRNRSQFKHSQSVINKITLYAINGAIATSLSALLLIFSFNLLSGTYYYRVFLYATPQLHVMSIISILTTRAAPEADDLNIQFSNFWMNTTTRADEIRNEDKNDSDVMPSA
jgi:hypothetical protein